MSNRQLHGYVEELARGIHEIGAFKDKTQSPGGKGFRLKLHEKQPDAPLSPMYLDLRMLRSEPRLLRHAARVFKQMVVQQTMLPGRLADVPTAATPIVAVLSDMMEIGMVTPREGKAYGAGGAGPNIDGFWQDSMVAAVFDDLVTGADSKFAAIKTLEAGNEKYGRLIVRDVYVLVDRMQGGSDQITAAGYNMHSAFTIAWLLEFYRESGMMSHALYEEIEAYRTQAAVKV